MTREVVVVDAVRTPIGRYKGQFKNVRPDDLGAIVIKALLERNPELDPTLIDDVILGNANGAGEDNRNVGRMSLLLAGLPQEVSGTTVNRLCGSSLDAGVAFGLFAVFSLIRFRSAVTNAKDIAYIFFGLCVGMTAGLFQFELAIVLTLFASLVFYLLFKVDYGAGKDTQILKITVPENLNEENLFDDILQDKTDSYQLRQVETTNLGTMILYTFSIRSKVDTKDQELLNVIRERNANLKVSLSYLEMRD